jgi:FG-GAP-like repeat
MSMIRRFGVVSLFCILFCLVAGVEPALTASNPFTPATGSPIATGTGATFVATGDLNGDGRPDVVVVNSGANNISVLLANGAGTFLAPVNYAVGTSPSDVAIGDVNGDGRPDLVVTNTGSDTVSVLLNVGGGAFSAPINLPVAPGSGPEGVAVADVNGDGIKDIIVSNSNGNSVTVFLATGIGGFVLAGSFTTGSAPSGVVVADFNGDGKPDLATSNNVGSASILLGNGNGTFQTNTDINLSPSATSTCSDPDALVAVDLNGDTKPDIAVACTGGSVSILLSNGNGTFATPVSYSTIAGTAGSGPEAIAAADFDGKNGIDLVIADTSNTAVFLLNTGNGTFTTSLACQPAGNGAFGVAAADFNGDSRPDIAVSNSIDGTVSILLNAGTIASGVGTCGPTPPPPPVVANFTITATPASVTVKAGTLATYTVTVTPGPGFSEAVALTCSSSAPASGCSLNPKTVLPKNGASVNSTLSVATNFNLSGGPFSKADPSQSPMPHSNNNLYAMLSFGGVGVFGLVLSARRLRSKRRPLVGVVITILGVLVILMTLQGCGKKEDFPLGPEVVTPPGTYAVTVTGTAGSGSTAQVATATPTPALIVN